MSSHVIRIVEEVGPGADPDMRGQYIVDFDPDYRVDYCSLNTSFEVAKAKQFESGEAAIQFWLQPSKLRPVRPDGKPNRPLTAYSVEILPVEGL
jgi:hypothetical protein